MLARVPSCLALTLLVACSEAPREAPKEAPKEAEPFADPAQKLPPPPAGAAVLPDRKRPIYVQRCDAAHACPDLLQAAGETHCRGLMLDGVGPWRLPDREEIARFKEVKELAALEGFHWSRTTFAEDAAQAWIVDPVSGSETTIPRTRKPFRVRCVLEP